MNRLRSFRHIEGMTQQELGHMLGVSPQLISAVESGRRELSFDISPIGYSLDRFLVPDMSEPLHRQKAASRVADSHRARELLRLAGELFTELRDRNPKAPAVRLERMATPSSSDEIEASALEIRLMLAQEESGPIRNLTSMVERAGVCLVPLVGFAGIDGMSCWVEGQPVIGLSPSVTGDRFRFSLAHELAHLVLHRTRGGITESQANRFAGAFLISREDMDIALPETPTLRDFVSLKSSWGISAAALVYRAHELGHIDDRRYRSIQIQMSRWQRSEPGEFLPAYGSLLSRLVDAAGGFTVADELGLRRQHVIEITNWTSLRAA